MKGEGLSFLRLIWEKSPHDGSPFSMIALIERDSYIVRYDMRTIEKWRVVKEWLHAGLYAMTGKSLADGHWTPKGLAEIPGMLGIDTIKLFRVGEIAMTAEEITKTTDHWAIVRDLVQMDPFGVRGDSCLFCGEEWKEVPGREPGHMPGCLWVRACNAHGALIERMTSPEGKVGL